MKTKTLTVMYQQGILLAVALSLIPAATLWAMTTEETTPPPRPSIPIVQTSYVNLPLSFEANQGQWDPAVQFVTRGGGHQLFLTPSEAVLTLRTGEAKNQERGIDATPRKTLSSPSPSSYSAVRMRFEGADSQAEMVGLEPLPGIVNYFIGDDPSKWRTNIPTYQKVEYKNLYLGIDLVYYGNQGHLEYDLVVAPGADPSQIMLAFDGAKQIAVDEQGDLVLTLPRSSTDIAERAAPTLRLHKPVVYQRNEQGEKHLLAGTYVMQASETTSPQQTVAVHPRETPQIAFQIASYDENKPLIIDPVLSWATYLGGSGSDGGGGIAIDVAGNAYITGATSSADFPGTAGSPIQSTLSGPNSNAFVTKLNASGTAIVYSTYLGGGGDNANGIAVDQAGEAYVTGITSGNFPGTAGSPIQSTMRSDHDAFVAKLNATGTAILYSTYLGSNNEDIGQGIAVDRWGNAYVTGATWGYDFMGTAGSPIQSTHGGGITDAFVTKLNAAGTALVYSTYLGGREHDSGGGIAVDAAGNAYVTGLAASPDFLGAAGSSIPQTYPGYDAFVTKLNATGTAILYSIYLGGSGGDKGSGIAVDAEGNAYVTGDTDSPNFPGTAGSPIQSTLRAFTNAFVTKVNPAGSALVFSTYLGGSGGELGGGIAVDASGNAYVTGTTSSADFPGTAGSPIQSMYGGGDDAPGIIKGDSFVTKLNTVGTALVYSTYLGGSGFDAVNGIAVDAAGNAYVTGGTISAGFPGTTSSPLQNMLRGKSDAFVAKITSANIVNDLVTFVPLASAYRTSTDPTGCPAGFVGTFGFKAQLTNKSSSPPLSDLAVKVTTLSNGNLLHNADGGNGGVGSTLTVPKTGGYADGTLSPGESVEVTFSLCLKANTPFTFFVDVLGMQ